MGHYISGKDRTGEYKHFKVPEEIKNYIIQLECYIHDPKKSGLLKQYSERFGCKKTRIDKFLDGSLKIMIGLLVIMTLCILCNLAQYGIDKLKEGDISWTPKSMRK